MTATTVGLPPTRPPARRRTAQRVSAQYAAEPLPPTPDWVDVGAWWAALWADIAAQYAADWPRFRAAIEAYERRVLDLEVALQAADAELAAERAQVRDREQTIVELTTRLSIAQGITLRARKNADRAQGALLAEIDEHGTTELRLEAEMAERVRIAALHAQLSAENAALRHRLIDTSFRSAARAITGSDYHELTIQLAPVPERSASIPPAIGGFDTSDVDVDDEDPDAPDTIVMDVEALRRAGAL